MVLLDSAIDAAEEVGLRVKATAGEAKAAPYYTF